MTLGFSCGLRGGQGTADWVLVAAALPRPDVLDVTAVLPSTLLPFTGDTVVLLAEVGEERGNVELLEAC